MIVLFTDFGARDPYVGQVKSRIHEYAPQQVVVDLLHETPDYDVLAGAHLIAALSTGFPPGTVFMCVVDPGVGTERDGVVVAAGGHWFVGPDNGLLSIAVARRTDAMIWRINWGQPASSTFHGRDVFAVVSALIARGEFPSDKLAQKAKLDVEFDSEDLSRVVYIDHFGNAWTGVRGSNLAENRIVTANGVKFRYAKTFGFVGKGEGFWFVNSAGLLELAINSGNAARRHDLKVGDLVQIH